MALANAIQEIYFYKTPFDNAYKNVPYFSSSSNADILNFFNTNVTGFKWKYPNLNISLRETNGKIILNYGGGTDTQLTLQGRLIKDYNYCAIGYKLPTSSTLVYIFYFITAYSTLNQGPNPTTELQLQYDVWVNNFDKISAYSTKYPLSKGTINTYFTYNNKTYTNNNFGTKQVQTVFQMNPYNRIPSPSTPDPLLSHPRLLWLKVTLDSKENVYIKNSGDESWALATNVGTFASASQLPVIYAPIAVLSPDGLNIETGTYSVKGYYNRSITNTTVISNLSFTLDGLHVVDASVTAYPPFIVNYEDNIFTVYNRFNFAQLSYENGSNFPITFSDAVSGNKHFCVFSKELDYNIDWEQEFTYEAKIYVPEVSRYDSATLSQDEIIASSTALRVPYNNYLKLDICGTQYNIIPPANTYYYRIRIKHLESGAFIYVAYYNTNDTVISRSPYMRIDEIGGIPVVSDSLSVYMRNNGNTYAANSYAIGAKGFTNAMNKSVGIGLSAAFGNVSGVVNGALQFNQTLLDTELAQKSLSAKIQDVDNQRDNIQPVSNNSIENIFRNQVIIYKISAKYDSNDAINLAYDEHCFGVNCNIYDSINAQHKKHFDYKQFSTVSIPTINNIDERLMVETILTTGVTYWYVNQLIADELSEELKSLDKMIGNEVI